MLALLVVAACSITYRVAGFFEDSNKVFAGTVVMSVGNTGVIDVMSADGKLHCTGTSLVTKLPRGSGRLGAQGVARAVCNDGSTFKAEFTQTRETGGTGLGVDDKANVVRLFFDDVQAVAESEMRSAMLRQATAK